MKELGKNKQLAINMIAALLGFAINAAISFFVAPFVRSNVGEGAYGFISMANNFVQYAHILTIALNSMASRFITVKIYEKDEVGARRYFSSVLIADGVMAVALAIIGSIVVLNIEHIVNVPENLVTDVKLLFAFIFGNFILTIISSIFGSATYIRNKLYLTSIVTIITNILRGALVFLLFSILPAHVFYMGITAMTATVVTLITNIQFTKKLVPELKLSRKYFDFKAIKELLASGLWNSVLKLGQTLLDALDILIANLLINAGAMDVLSLAKTVPVMVSNVMSTVSGVFAPNFNITYAKKQYDVLLADIRQSIKIMGVLMNVPIAALTIFGPAFFKLWIPDENVTVLQILSLLTIAKLLVSGSIDCLSNIFTITNKLKANSIAVLVSGIVSFAGTFLLVKYTDLGVYAVAGVSSVCSILRNLCFTIPYSAKCLNLKWYTFYKDVGKSVLSYLAMISVGIVTLQFIKVENWFMLVICAGVFCILCLALAYFIVLNRKERTMIKSKLLGKFLKK